MRDGRAAQNRRHRSVVDVATTTATDRQGIKLFSCWVAKLIGMQRDIFTAEMRGLHRAPWLCDDGSRADELLIAHPPNPNTG